MKTKHCSSSRLISALIVSYFICGLLVYVTIIVMDNREARVQAQRNSQTMQRFKTHVVNDMVSDEHTDEGQVDLASRSERSFGDLSSFQPSKGHSEDLRLFEQKLMMHFNPQFMDEEHSDHQATESH